MTVSGHRRYYPLGLAVAVDHDREGGIRTQQDSLDSVSSRLYNASVVATVDIAVGTLRAVARVVEDSRIAKMVAAKK
jgi:predicted metalloprotease with PDZ domain